MTYSSIRMVWMRSLAIAILIGATFIGVDDRPAHDHPLTLAQDLSRESSAAAEFPDDVDVLRLDANQLLYQGYEQYNRDAFQAAINSWRAALAQYQKLGDRHFEATTLYCLQVGYDTQGNFPMALDVSQQADALGMAVDGCEAEMILPNNWQVRFHLEYTAWWYEDIDNMQIAMPENPGDRHPRFFSLAFEEGSTSYYQNQIQSLETSLDDARRQSDGVREMVTLTRLGDVYLQMNQYENAINVYNAALAIAQQQVHLQQQTRLLEKLGIIYFILEDDQESLNLHQEQLQLARRSGDLLAQVKALEWIGSIHYANQQYPEAMASYQQAVLLTRETGDREEIGRLLSKIGFVLDAQDQPELAIIFLKESVNIRQAIRQELQGRSQSFRQHYLNSIAETYRRLADLLLQGDRILEAQSVLDLLKVQELGEYLLDIQRSVQTDDGVTLLDTETQIQELQQDLTNRAIAIGEELAQLRQIANRTPEQGNRIIELEAMQYEIIAEFEDFIYSDDVQALVAQLSREARSQDLINKLDELITIQDNLRALEQNAVLLYPLILDDRIELVLVTPNSPPTRYLVEISRRDLNTAIVEFRQALETPTSHAEAIAQRLYHWLIQPLVTDLEAIDAQTIIYAPDGVLRYVPLAALHDGDRWLAERFRINHITAASLTDLNLRPVTQPEILAAAFSEGSIELQVGERNVVFAGLPFAGQEVENLATAFPGTTQLFNEDFSPTATVPIMDDYTIVHLATHAEFVQGTPAESFILFGDGNFITLDDIKEWRGRFRRVDLIVLSACETGLGENLGNGEEILGFGYLMQQAGARAAIASLWQVSDGGTQILMNAFYTALSNGYSKAEALQRAQQALITNDVTVLGGDRGVAVEVVDTRTGQPLSRSGDLAHPYYWAPFILIGNGL